MARLALVTGAAKRIGRAIAMDLASHGWDIVVHYNRSAEEAKTLANDIQAMGQNAFLAEIDLANGALADQLIPALVKELGPLNALVNNAALFEPDEQDPDGSRHQAINVDAPRLLSKSYRNNLPAKAKGVIINILDATPLPPSFNAYGRSKAALKEMTLNMARSFAPSLRVNGVAPMYVLPSPRQTEESFRAMAKGRLALPEDVASAVRKLIEMPDSTGLIVTVG
ncbi:MAG: SDR family NAD(P)-dependent oxidoreductase [Alphaproteobacteria bacterium]|nr:SDR family NAD(P)-dependent oxidoreductase [Alphaproteobacteria bacterium]